MTVRTTRTGLLALVALLATLVVLPAAPASAATYAVSLTTSTPVVTYGADAAFTAVVTENGAPAANVYVYLDVTEATGGQRTAFAEYTDANGVVALTDFEVHVGGSYVALAGFDEDASAPVAVSVAYAVQPLSQTSFFKPTLVSPTAVPPGGVIGVQGTVAPAGSTTPLTVEQRFGTGPWQVVGSVPVAADGRFAMSLGKRSQVGTWSVRLTHPAEGALVAGSGEASTKVTVTGVGRKKAWHPIAGTKSSPARWGTCRIGYRLNPKRMPASGRADLREAMRRITQGSGIKFRYLGTTSVTPRRGYGGPGLNKIVVAWAPPSKSGGLLGPGIGGVGGTSRTSSRLLSGYVLMNSSFTSTADAGFGAGQPIGLVLMHELGHVVGLDHATDQRQIMAPGSPLPASVWGAADLNGLRRVGSRCL